MAALQQSLTSVQSKYIASLQIPRGFLTHKPFLNLSFSASTCTSIQLKLTGTSTSRRHLVSVRAAGSGGAATNYAAALADIAKTNNSLDDTLADVEKIEKILSDQGVYNFFTNPIIGTDKKSSLLSEIINASSLQPHTANFLNLLLDSGRIGLINEIVEEFEVVYNELTNTELAVVSSVVKLESQQLAQIAKQVQKLTGAKNVRIKTVIDPSLIAGFTIRYGNTGSRLIDMSVKKQLEEVASQLDLDDITIPV